MAATIVVANQKGGVGKSTTVLNSGACLAELGAKVLLCDMDPHAGLTFSAGYHDPEQDFPKRNALQVLLPGSGVGIRDAAVETKLERMHLIPSAIGLANIDERIADRADWAFLLRKAIASAANDYDYVVVDSPPGIGKLSAMCICAADLILVPVQPEFLAGRGLKILHLTLLSTLLEQVDRVGVPVRYLITLFDARTKHHAEMADEVRRVYGEEVLQSVVMRSTLFPESTSAGLPLQLFDKAHRGSSAYRDAVQEMLVALGEERPRAANE